MSHIVTLQTRVQDPAAIVAACQRLNLPLPVEGTARLYSGEATGLLLQLPGWLYHAIIDPLTGLIRYDTFEGRWGDPKELDRFLQLYAVERAKLEARKKGYSASEQALEDGSPGAVAQLCRRVLARKQVWFPVFGIPVCTSTESLSSPKRSIHG